MLKFDNSQSTQEDGLARKHTDIQKVSKVIWVCLQLLIMLIDWANRVQSYGCLNLS